MSPEERLPRADSRRVLVLQHIEPEGPGLIARAIAAQQLELSVVKSFAGEAVPESARDLGGLVVMGGPMGVADVRRLSYLADEMKLIESALRHEVPILGVCLGSQLLAHVLGAKVTPSAALELGWQRIALTEAGLRDGLFKGLESSFTALHWHGDAFELPERAILLAESQMTAHQAFAYGSSAYGILFHLEATRPIVEAMVRSFPEDLARASLAPADILNRVDEHLASMEERAARVFGAWVDLAAARRDAM